MRPDNRKYLSSHEWCQIDGETAILGLTDHAISQLGELIHLELPEVGSQVTAGDTFGEVESVKSVNDIYAPVSGEVVEANEDLVDNLDALKDDPWENGWMIKVKFTDTSDQLLDLAAYEATIEE